MANADRIEVGDIISLYGFGCESTGENSESLENCELLDHPSSSFPFWIVRNTYEDLLYIPVSKVYVKLDMKGGPDAREVSE